MKTALFTLFCICISVLSSSQQLQAPEEWYQQSIPIPYCSSGISESPWESLGPIDLHWPLSNSGGTPWQGIVNAVALNALNPNIIYAGGNTSGLFKTTDGGLNWHNITDQLEIPGLGISAIVMHPLNPETLYVATGSTSNGYGGYSLGVMRTYDGGLNWQYNANNDPWPFDGSGKSYLLRCLAMHPTEHQRIYAGGKNKIYTSSDGGISWTTTFDLQYEDAVNGNEAGFVDFEFDPTNPAVMFASTMSSGALDQVRIYKSIDYGITWSNITPAANMGAVIRMDRTPADPLAIYIMYSSSGGIRLQKTLDAGISWIDVALFNSMSFGYWKNEFEMSDLDQNLAYIGLVKFYIGRNNGTNWATVMQTQQMHDDIRDLKIYHFNEGLEYLLVGSDGGVQFAEVNPQALISGSATILWGEKNGLGLNNNQIYGLADIDRLDTQVFGGQDMGTWLVEPQQSFGKIGSGDGTFTSSNEYYERLVIHGDQNTRYYRMYGASGFSIGMPNNNLASPHNPSSGNLRNRNYFQPSDQRYLFIGGNRLAKWKFNPVTNTFLDAIVIKDALPGQPKITAFAAAASDPNTIYLAYDGAYWNDGILNSNNTNLVQNGQLINKFFRSTDGGLTFTDLTNQLYFSYTGGNGATTHVYHWNAISAIVADPKNAQHIMTGFNYLTHVGARNIIESWDGGNTWTDISEGLDGYPIHQLLWQDGTNIIYAATDAGVYRKISGSTDWECFNNGLPPCIVTSMDIDYCENTMYIATYGRGNWKAQLPEVNDDQVFNSNYTIAPFEVHNYPGNITVETGVTLTVQGKLYMKSGKRITVRKGARLIVDGGLITNGCGELWVGIVVDGDDGISQSPAQNQGYVEVKNNGTISFANIAIALKSLDANCQPINGTGGGIARCTDAILQNNYVDVEFGPYRYVTPAGNISANRSWFYNTQFLSNAALPNELKNKWHVRLNDNSTVHFKGCIFKNDRSVDNIQDQEGMGISSFNSTFKVDDYCPGMLQAFTTCPEANRVHCKFENLEWGIRATSLDEVNTFSVNNTDFDGNSYGIMAINTRNLAITNSNFDVTPESYIEDTEDPVSPYGVQLNICNGYKVEQNYFTSNDASERRAGLVINNSNAFSFATLQKVEQNNRIYYNDFTNLYAATIAQGDNRTDDVPDEGLELLCGYYEGNVYDIAVTNQGTIALKQGNDQLNPIMPSLEIYPAGNLFMTNISGCSDQNALHVNDDSEVIIYFHSLGPNSAPSSDCVNPFLAYLEPLDFPWESRESECNDLSAALTSHNAYRNKIAQRLSELGTVKSNIEQVEDGGDTPALLSAITNGSITSQQLKNQLLPLCPNLSRKVLYEVLNRQPQMDDYHLCEILLQSSPLPLDIWTTYNDNPLPSMLHQLVELYQNANQNDLSFLYTLQKITRSEKDFYKSEYGRYALMGDDEDEMKLEDLKIAAEMENSVYDERLKMSIALQRRDFVTLADLLNSYFTDETKDAWHKVFEILAQVKEDGNNYSDIPENAIAVLQEIAESGKSGSIMASVLLESFTPGFELDHTVVFPSGNTRSIRTLNPTEAETQGSKILLYPNPAVNQTYLVMPKELMVFDRLYVWIYDSSGKLVYVADASQSRGLFELNTTELAAGQHTCQLVAGGKPMHSIQLLISK